MVALRVKTKYLRQSVVFYEIMHFVKCFNDVVVSLRNVVVFVGTLYFLKMFSEVLLSFKTQCCLREMLCYAKCYFLNCFVSKNVVFNTMFLC